MNVVIISVALGTARAALRRAFWASVRRMSLARATRVSTIGAPSSSPCWSAVTNIATCSESFLRRSSAKAWRRLMPRSIWRRVMRSSSAQGPSYLEATRSSAWRKPRPALTTTARTSRKSGRVRSISSFLIRIADQMPTSVQKAPNASSSSATRIWPRSRNTRKPTAPRKPYTARRAA